MVRVFRAVEAAPLLVIRAHFRSTFNLSGVSQCFTFAMNYINCNKRCGKAVNFLFDYTLLYIELKLQLDDHNQVNHTWDDQLESCDSVGNPEDDKWPEITATNSVPTRLLRLRILSRRGRSASWTKEKASSHSGGQVAPSE